MANLTRFAEGRGVLGLLDEDGRGVAAREREVADRLEARGLPGIAFHEGRCLLLPARNIETWLYWLTAQRDGRSLGVNETTDYNAAPPAGIPRIGNQHCRPAGDYLHTLNHTQLPAGCPSMLGQGLGHLRKFLEAVRR